MMAELLVVHLPGSFWLQNLGFANLPVLKVCQHELGHVACGGLQGDLPLVLVPLTELVQLAGYVQVGHRLQLGLGGDNPVRCVV